jgi:stage II sporulation protein D
MNVIVYYLFAFVVSIRLFEHEHPKWLEVETTKQQVRIAVQDSKLKIGDTTANYYTITGEAPNLLRVEGIDPRHYGGGLTIYVQNGELVILNLIDDQEYLASVVSCEMPTARFEALKAQAVAARTFLYGNLQRHGSYDLCDLTHCQVYKGSDYQTEIARRSVDSTDGLVLKYAGKLCEVYYHSTCGGRTADPGSVWGGDSTPPYLISVNDSDFCKNSPFYRWRFEISKDSLAALLGSRPLGKISVVDWNRDGRPKFIKLCGLKDSIWTAWDFRNRICQESDWNTIKSAYFDIIDHTAGIELAGRGLGHGVGMCQFGACGMAEKGYDFIQILKHYFPGADIKKWP